MSKPILCLDFDGVCHSYTSGWKGADVIPDPPVEGLESFLSKACQHFSVQIFSSRSHQLNGIRAMQRWFFDNLKNIWWVQDEKEERQIGIGEDPDDRLDIILFPTEKPQAFLTIDDRAITFNGTWPKIDDLLNFKPWNK